MAFRLPVTTETGDTADYWKVDSFLVKQKDRIVVVEFNCYKSQALAPTVEPYRAMQRKCYFKLADFVAAVQGASAKGHINAVLEACYALAKQDPKYALQWSEAEDILEE